MSIQGRRRLGRALGLAHESPGFPIIHASRWKMGFPSIKNRGLSTGLRLYSAPLHHSRLFFLDAPGGRLNIRRPSPVSRIPESLQSQFPRNIPVLRVVLGG